MGRRQRGTDGLVRQFKAAAAYVTAVGLLGAVLVIAGPARADTQADYEAAKARLASLAHQSEQLVDAYNAGAEKLSELNKAVEAAEVRVKQLEGQVEEQRLALSSQAVEVYKYGSSHAAASIAGIVEIRDLEEYPTAQKYLGEVQADTKQALDKYAAAKADADAEKASLADAKAKQESVVADLKAKQRQIEASVAEQERITAQFKAKLDAERAAAEARARAAAEQASRNQSSGGGASRPASGGSRASRGVSSGGGGDAGPPSQGASSAVAFARAQLGKPYRWGASGPDAYDCSGLTSAAWRHGGKSIPRTSSAQAGLPRVSSPAPGDIAWRPGHVALYVGGGTVISAPQTGDVVKYASAGSYRSFHRP